MNPAPSPPPALTQALQQALCAGMDPRMVADLVFLDCWERTPQPGSAAAMRVSQIRRAHPSLAQAIRLEVTATGRAPA